MQNLEGYIDEKRHEDIINEILDLKLKAPKSVSNKKKIQKLQQELTDIEKRLKV